MNVKVNENCIGCGFCVGTCPDVFSMTDADVAEANVDGVDLKKQKPLIREAADGCPVNAIEVDD